MRELSETEALIMRAIWECREDVAVQALIQKLEEEYGRKYQRTTVVTFLNRMADKGFVRTYRIGRLSYIHPLVEEETYRDYILEKDLTRWYEGQPSYLISALVRKNSISPEEGERIRRILDGIDD